MGDLTDFLLERIVEDESAAHDLLRDLEGQIAESGFEADERGPFTPTRQLAAEMWAQYAGQTRRRNFARGQTIARFADPARVLAECEAKRRIVAAHPRETVSGFSRDAIDFPDGWCDADGTYDDMPRNHWPCDTMRALALPYQDHPDFDPDWRVSP